MQKINLDWQGIPQRNYNFKSVLRSQANDDEQLLQILQVENQFRLDSIT
jgi:hypothetical protein